MTHPSTYPPVINPFALDKPIPAPSSESNVKMEVITVNDNGNSEEQTAPRKPWMKRAGGPIVKVAPEVKRRRKNYQARKLLMPKNPLMILNELKPAAVFNFLEKSKEGSPTSSFEAIIEVDGLTFSALGQSKKQAQQEAAETCLRSLYFDKLLDQLMKKDGNQGASEKSVEGDAEMKDANAPTDDQTDGATKSHQIPEDDTPWSGLASLAMYKLVSFWHSPCNIGVQSSLLTKPVPDSPAPVVGKVPPNPTQMDPVMVLNQMSPHSKFTEETRDVRSGATVFTISVNFNGSKYFGQATKKRLAKKICAKAALETVGIKYSDDQ